MKKTKLTQPPRAPGTRIIHNRMLRQTKAGRLPHPAPIAAPERKTSRRLHADFLALCFYPGMDDHNTAA